MLNASPATTNENWIEVLGIKRARISVLIIGNNPIEIASIYNVLVGIRSKNYLTDVCFDIKDSIDRIAKNKPEVILIDDNLVLDDINKLVRVLKHNSKTKHIKVIALKSSNWNFNIIDNVDDFILKDAIKSELIDRIIEKNLYPKENQLV